ncbi:Tetracycline resistance protein, class C [Phycisphaerales bacterium]|nr:Tetracycline resistance protein, class C [Phycisphaerales bacterium]
MHRPAPKLVFVFFTLLLDVLGFGLLIPVAPRLIATVQGLNPEGAEHDTSLALGPLMALYAAMQFVFSPILGSLSDRFGRRPVLLCALFGSALDYFAATQAPYLTATFGSAAGMTCLFVTRALNGVSGATIPVCSAYIADITPPEKRAAGFGIIGAAFGLGFVFGPLIGGVLGDDKITLPLLGHGNVTFPYYAAGVLTALNWLYGFFIIPESLAREHRRPFSWEKANPMGALRWLAQHHVVALLVVTLFISNIAQFGLHATWVLSMQKRFGWTPLYTGWSLFTVGITSAIVQGLLARKIIPKLGERACLLGGLVVGVLAFAAYGLATHGWMIYAIIAAASIGGVAGPAAQAICSKGVPPNEQGLLQGATGSLTSVAGVLGPLIGAGVFFLFTPKEGPAPFLGPSAPFFTGAVLCALSVVPVLLVWGRMPRVVQQAPREEPFIAGGNSAPVQDAAADE